MVPCMPVVSKVIDGLMASHFIKDSVEASRAVDPDFALQRIKISCAAALKMRRAGYQAGCRRCTSKRAQAQQHSQALALGAKGSTRLCTAHVTLARRNWEEAALY